MCFGLFGAFFLVFAAAGAGFLASFFSISRSTYWHREDKVLFSQYWPDPHLSSVRKQLTATKNSFSFSQFSMFSDIPVLPGFHSSVFLSS
jgi:hypothetical protein